MATNTANYNLVKPSGAPGGDLVDIAVLNANMDILDTVIKALDTSTDTRLDVLEAPPNAKIRRTAQQSIPNSTFTLISFDTEEWDTNAMFVPTSTNLTIKTAGLYHVIYNVGYANNATGMRFAILNKNGTEIDREAKPANPASDDTQLQRSGYYRFAVNDVLTINSFQTSGGALNTSFGASGQPTLQVTRVAP